MSRPRSSPETSRRFREWFQAWGPDLWALTYPGEGYDEESKEVFADLLDRTRRRAGRRGRGFGEHRLTSLFLKEWLDRHTRRADRQQAEDRILLVAVFGLRWPLDRLALVLGTGESNVRFRIFEALKRRSGLEIKDLATLGRDCARQDLFAVDMLLNLQWKDPLSFFERERILAHDRDCPRCRTLAVKAKAIVEEIARVPAPMMPTAVGEEVDARVDYASRWSGTGFMSSWPWAIRLPAQLVLLFAIVYGMIALPYIGDIFPSFHEARRQWYSKVKTQLARKAPATPAPIGGMAPGPVSSPAAVVAEWLASPSPSPIAATSVGNTAVAWIGRMVDHAMDVARVAKAPATKAPSPVAAEATPVATTTAASAAPIPTQVAALASPLASASPKASASPVAKVAAKDAAFDERNFYQWSAFSGADLDGVAAQVGEILGRYAVEPAGELALGAKYRGGRYFHFSLPTESYEPMMAEIEALGLTKFTRQVSRSWRKTPLERRRVVFLLK